MSFEEELTGDIHGFLIAEQRYEWLTSINSNAKKHITVKDVFSSYKNWQEDCHECYDIFYKPCAEIIRLN